MNLKNMDAPALRALVARYDALVMNRYPEPPLLVKAKALEGATERTRLNAPMVTAWAATKLGGVVQAHFTKTTDFLPKGAGHLIGWYADRLDAMRAHRNWMARDVAFQLAALDDEIAVESDSIYRHVTNSVEQAIDAVAGVQRRVGKSRDLAAPYGSTTLYDDNGMVVRHPAPIMEGAPVNAMAELPAPIVDGVQLTSAPRVDDFTDPEPPYAAAKRAEAAETQRQEIEAGSTTNPGTVKAGKKASAAVKAAADRIEKQAAAKRAAAEKRAADAALKAGGANVDG